MTDMLRKVKFAEEASCEFRESVEFGGGKYRLVARVNFAGHRLWIKYILPHKEYDRLNLREDEKCR